MLKLNIERETIKSCPKLSVIGAETFSKIGEIAISAIQANITSQQRADGSPIKKNEPSTVSRKELAGREPLSLIDEEHRFIHADSFSATATDSNVTIEPRSDELKDLNLQVQQKDYTGWFGINAEARRLIGGLAMNAVKGFFGALR